MENSGNGKKQEHRMTALEIKVDAIMNNHLPHIQAKVDSLMSRFWWMITLLIATLVGIIATYLK